MDADTINNDQLNRVYTILQNERRRMVMHYLYQNGSTNLSQLAEYVAGQENDKEEKNLNSQERKRVYVGLYQCHLPKMDDHGVIDYDSDRGTVEFGENFAEAYRPIKPEEDDDSWPGIYLAYSVSAFALVATTGFLSPWLSVVFAVAAMIGTAVLSLGDRISG